MTFTLHAPQIIWLCWNALALVAATQFHGKPVKINVYVQLLLFSLSFSLLYWGGFFRQ